MDIKKYFSNKVEKIFYSYFKAVITFIAIKMVDLSHMIFMLFAFFTELSSKAPHFLGIIAMQLDGTWMKNG